jgi:phytoene dehydrogenase-like protein
LVWLSGWSAVASTPITAGGAVSLPGLEAVVRSARQSRARQVPDDIHLFTCVATDADATPAPDGQDTLYLYVPVSPVDPQGGWDTPWTRRPWWRRQRSTSKASRSTSSGDACSSPAELARRVHATVGSTVMQVDFLPHRLGPLRPAVGLGDYRTSVDGLYLGGSGSHPGFGMTVLPGRLSAREVLRDHKRGSKSSRKG